MKTIQYLIMAFVSLFIASCGKDEVNTTPLESNLTRKFLTASERHDQLQLDPNLIQKRKDPPKVLSMAVMENVTLRVYPLGEGDMDKAEWKSFSVIRIPNHFERKYVMDTPGDPNPFLGCYEGFRWVQVNLWDISLENSGYPVWAMVPKGEGL